MKSADELLTDYLNRMPKEASTEEVRYFRYVIEKVKAGLESIEKEGGLDHAEVEKRFSTWLSP